MYPIPPLKESIVTTCIGSDKEWRYREIAVWKILCQLKVAQWGLLSEFIVHSCLPPSLRTLDALRILSNFDHRYPNRHKGRVHPGAENNVKQFILEVSKNVASSAQRRRCNPSLGAAPVTWQGLPPPRFSEPPFLEGETSVQLHPLQMMESHRATTNTCDEQTTSTPCPVLLFLCSVPHMRETRKDFIFVIIFCNVLFPSVYSVSYFPEVVEENRIDF